MSSIRLFAGRLNLPLLPPPRIPPSTPGSGNDGQVSKPASAPSSKNSKAFGTRKHHVEPGRTPGPAASGAARNWIPTKSYSPKLDVRFEKFRVKKQGQRMLQGRRSC